MADRQCTAALSLAIQGQRNLASEIARAMAMPVPVTVNGRRKNVSTMTALVWRVREKALGGDHKSLQLLINLHQVHMPMTRDRKA
jgi:hypothetical protein